MFLGYSRVFYDLIFLTPLNTQLNIMTISDYFRVRENKVLHTQLLRWVERLPSQVMRHLWQQLPQSYDFESQFRPGLSEISKSLI